MGVDEGVKENEGVYGCRRSALSMCRTCSALAVLRRVCIPVDESWRDP